MLTRSNDSQSVINNHALAVNIHYFCDLWGGRKTPESDLWNTLKAFQYSKLTFTLLRDYANVCRASFTYWFLIQKLVCSQSIYGDEFSNLIYRYCSGVIIVILVHVCSVQYLVYMYVLVILILPSTSVSPKYFLHRRAAYKGSMHWYASKQH